MSRPTRIFLYIFLCAFAYSALAQAQEQVGHLNYNPFLKGKAVRNAAARKTAVATDPLNLPFFEDFTGYDPYPDSTKWADFEVYINNTMCVQPVSRGVATFDALDSRGIPYDSFSNGRFRYADTLTSQPINMDLGTVTPADSVYLSFFYQPQGNGFFPLTKDSLILFLKDHFGGYVKVWSVAGSALQPFRQVMIPITDSIFFDSSFEFRFVNIAALNYADAIWNIDYIRLNRDRNMNDTPVNDIGFCSNPTYLLNDYTSMPYRQFYANRPSELAPQYYDSIRNNYSVPQVLTAHFTATALNNGTVLQPMVTHAIPATPPYSAQQLSFPSYSVTIAPPGPNTKVVFENKYYIDQISTDDPGGNDTVVCEQVFDNYLAYDDGTAEKSYYLNLFPTLPGKVAIEYHLNEPDTMRGMAIYFGRQIPFASYKSFTIAVYSALQGINGAVIDNLLYQEELLDPTYADGVNHFYYYSFTTPLVLPAGTFYAGAIQPAESGADSLYYGLDVNRIGGNHAYYNVLSSWSPSLVSGALMMRPLLGGRLTVGVKDVQPKPDLVWHMMPNPATSTLKFKTTGEQPSAYSISDMAGHMLLQGNTAGGNTVNIAGLAPGMYLVNLAQNGVSGTPQKLIKL